jgi:hypothetical protein
MMFSCLRRAARDRWGGCRCQALALTGRADRTDPACALSADHAITRLAEADAAAQTTAFAYRRMKPRDEMLPRSATTPAMGDIAPK